MPLSNQEKPCEVNPFFPLEIEVQATLENVADVSNIMVRLCWANNTYFNSLDNSAFTVNGNCSYKMSTKLAPKIFFQPSQLASSSSSSEQQPDIQMSESSDQQDPQKAESEPKRVEQPDQEDQDLLKVDPEDYHHIPNEPQQQQQQHQNSSNSVSSNVISLNEPLLVQIEIVELFELDVPDFDSQFLKCVYRNEKQKPLGVLSLVKTPTLFYLQSSKKIVK